MGPVDPSPAPAVTVNAASSGGVELMPPLGATPSSGSVGERRAHRHEGGDAPWVGVASEIWGRLLALGIKASSP